MFQCWIASSLLKYKVDKKASLALAKQHLSFGCTEEEVNNVYSKLRRLKKMFLRHVGKFKKTVSSNDSISKAEDIMKDMLDARMFESVPSIKQNVEFEIEERPENLEFNADWPISQQEQALKSKIEVKRLSKSIEQIQKKCDERMTKLILKQQEEVQEFLKTWEEESARLEKEYRSDLVCYINSNSPVTLDVFRRLDDTFGKKLEERKLQKGMRCKELEAKHLAETNEERKKAICLLEEVKSLGKAELSCGSESGDTRDDNRVHDGHENVASVSGVRVEEQNPNSKQACNMAPSHMAGTAGSEAVRYGIPSGELHPNREADAVVSIMASQRSLMTAFEELSNLHRSADVPENNGFDDQHSPEQIPDGPTSSAQDVPECLPNELVGGADFVDTVNPDVESRRETDELNVSVMGSVVIQNDAAGSSANGGSLSVELYLAKSSSVQPVVTLTQVGASPQNLAFHDECSSLSTSSGMQDGDAHASGNQNVLQQVKVLPLYSSETGPIDETNHEVLRIEHAEQLQLSPSTSSHFDHNQPDSHDTSGVERLPSEEHTASQTVGASPHFEHPEGPSNQTVIQTGVNLAPSPLIHAIDVSLSQNQPNFQLAMENAETPARVESATGIPNQFILGTQLGMHLPLDTSHGRFGTHMQLHSTQQMATLMPTQPLYADPLHVELERLDRETEQAIRDYEDMRLRLKSDWDKEIEENIAKICGKYDVKLKDAETAFLLEKKELNKNHNLLLMNKKLAEAFHSMCDGSLTMHQVVPSHFMQQRHLPLPQHAPRPSTVAGSASVQFVHHSPALFSSVPSSRPPLIVPIAPPPRNLQIVREMRSPAPHLQSFRPSSHTSPAPHLQSFRPLSHTSPAPHLQSFRPSSPMSLTSFPFLPWGLLQRNLPTASPSVPPSQPPAQHQPGATGGIREILIDVESDAHLPNILPTMPDLGPNFGSLGVSQFGAPGPIQQPQRNLLTTSPSVPPPQPPAQHQPGVTGGIREILIDVESGAHPPNILPSMPYLGPNFGSLDVSQFGAPGGGGGSGIIDSVIKSGVATDIVCLSDDE
ncbi:hypothetical protein U1Q18_021013 [Sarracenia purpurea var. burkii]